jgi:uncharacterized cupredoxin-like copper-binding protein
MLGAMRPWPLVAIITCMALAGCGGSPRSSSSQATATPAASASAQTTSSTQPATTSTQPATTSTDDTTTTTSSATAPPEVPKAKKHTHHASSSGHGGVSQGAHVETNVTVGANGDISPPAVSVPSGVGVELRVTNHGNGAATIVLSVPGHPSAHVAPGASATLETAGLKDGTYRILVNGTPRGQLMIGAQGGP